MAKRKHAVQMVLGFRAIRGFQGRRSINGHFEFYCVMHSETQLIFKELKCSFFFWLNLCLWSSFKSLSFLTDQWTELFLAKGRRLTSEFFQGITTTLKAVTRLLVLYWINFSNLNFYKATPYFERLLFHPSFLWKRSINQLTDFVYLFVFIRP